MHTYLSDMVQWKMHTCLTDMVQWKMHTYPSDMAQSGTEEPFMQDCVKTAAFHSLGCKVNAYETDAMEQMFRDAGYQIVPFSEKADIYVVNTCSVTNIADRKSRQILHRAKKNNPQAVVVAVGCYVQAAQEAVQADPMVDLAVGNNRKNYILADVEAYLQRQQMKEETEQQKEESQLTEPERREQPQDIIDISKENSFEDMRVTRIEGHTRAFIKIQDGCNQFCSYCIIPYTRGRIRSRKPQEILEEVRELTKQGIREIVLTGIHLSSYGLDWEGQGIGLLQIILQLHEIEEIERIRLGSLEPRIVTEDFVRTLAQLPKVCPHFHLSLQSGCDATLLRMNRKYNTKEYEECCRILRRFYDRPAITTDVIVGFPGETQEEFEDTVSFLERIALYEMHVFKYSVRQGTRAATMPHQVPEQEKNRRSSLLLELEQKQSRVYRESFCHGEQVRVLLEECVSLEDGQEYVTGFTEQYVRVAIPATEAIKNQVGKIVTVVLTELLTQEIALGTLD